MSNGTLATTRIVFTDAGIDDALALIFLNHHLEQGMDYIVCTGGNVDVRFVGNSCAFLKEVFSFVSEVYLGSNPPALHLREASDVHGPYGLGTFMAPRRSLRPYSELLSLLAGRELTLDVLVLGPGTDAAELLARPQVKGRVKNLLVMGGAFRPRGGRLGNITPCAEFNVFMDPEAAWKLMSARCPATWVPLDATEGHLYTESELLAGISNTQRGRLVRELFHFCAAAHQTLGFGQGVFMHDVLASAVWTGLIDAETLGTQVREVVGDGERRGLIVQESRPGKGARVTYTKALDHDTFLKRWQEMVRNLR